MDQNNDQRPMYDAVCSNCGQETQVPFEPAADRPVYCKECFQKQRGGGGTREMHSATCAECGGEASVPFEPKEDRPVYCKDCFAKQRG